VDDAHEQILAVLRGAGLGPGPVALLRHSRRESLREASVTAALEAQLTAEGRDLCRSFGARLPRGRPVRLFHSPVSRCADTALLIGEAVRAAGGEADVVGPLSQLGAPYLLKPTRAIDRFAEVGMAGFVRAWVAGEVAPEIVTPHRLAATELLEAVLAQRSEALDLHVTHDLTVVALLGLVLSVGEPGFPWPGFLDGCVLTAEEPVLCHYHGETHPLPAA
jgi:broad specificity phosphatase PhoE